MPEYIPEARPACQHPSWLVRLPKGAGPGWDLVDYAYIPVKEPTVPEECSDCNNMGTNIYVRVLDVAGNFISDAEVTIATVDTEAKLVMRPRGDLDYCYDPQGITYYGGAFEMSGDGSFDPSPPRNETGPYRAYMEGNSAALFGMGLPQKRHVQFILTFQRVEEDGEPEPPPEPTAGEWYIAKQTPRRILLKWQDDNA